MTYDCRSVLKHVLKCYDIFSDVHNNCKSCRGPVVSLSHATKSYRVNRPLDCKTAVFESWSNSSHQAKGVEKSERARCARFAS